jgi:hypothetical protein
MAKRSVRKQRREGGTTGGAATRAPEQQPAAGPVWRSPAFWIGGLVVGLAVAVFAAAAFVAFGDADDDPPAGAESAATPAGDEGVKSAEELQAEFTARDREQIEQLTNEAKDVADRLQPVMTDLETALPRDGAAPDQAPDGQLQEWLDTARDSAAPYEESISGATGHNVARLTLRAALDGLVGAIETYRLAGQPDADRDALIARASAQRDNAIRTWSAAGVQIDAINVDAGFGHQHVAQLGGAEAGAQPPDSLPEGTDARPQE